MNSMQHETKVRPVQRNSMLQQGGDSDYTQQSKEQQIDRQVHSGGNVFSSHWKVKRQRQVRL